MIKSSSPENTQNIDEIMTKLLIEAIKPQYEELANFNQTIINYWIELQ
jgi:hypothetical protein